MNQREKNIITGVTVGVLGVNVILFSLNNLIEMFQDPLTFFTTSSGYMSLDLFVLAITSFMYAYFMIIPAKTLKGKNWLAKIAFILGIILVIIPIIGIVLVAYYRFGFNGSLFVPYFMLLIPGLALVIHGVFMLKETKAKHEE